MVSSEGKSLPPSITKILVLFVLAGGLAFLTVFFPWSGPTPGTTAVSEDERFTEVVLSGLPALRERWREGDITHAYGTKSWGCEEMPFSTAVAPAFFQCNPHYMECWARGFAGVNPSIPVRVGGKTEYLELRGVFPEIAEAATGLRHGRWVTRAQLDSAHVPWSGLMVEVGVRGMGQRGWRMILADTCRGALLPERRYSYGPRPERYEHVLEMDWDNAGRKLLIDRYLVSRAEINQWIWAAKLKQVPLELDKKKWALPAKLERSLQASYCAFLGKRRMEAHLWDAASMLPTDVKRPFPSFVVKSWLPWTRDRRETFFERAAMDANWSPTRVDCASAFVHECVDKFPYRPHESDNVSWIGVHHVLGGEIEEFRNPIEPTLTRKASSWELPAADPAHQLGRRQETQEQASAFRCYREEFP